MMMCVGAFLVFVSHSDKAQRCSALSMQNCFLVIRAEERHPEHHTVTVSLSSGACSSRALWDAATLVCNLQAYLHWIQHVWHSVV